MIPLKKNFHGQKIFQMSLLKVENFQLQKFFPTENLCRPITFYKIFFPRKIFLSGNGRIYIRRRLKRLDELNVLC